MNAEMSDRPAADVYQVVTESIVAAIEAGAGEFVMPWHGQGISRPQNALTGNDYHGINVLALWAQAHLRVFATGWWGTYRQWREIGAQVQKGQRSSTIVFFKRFDEDRREGGERELGVNVSVRLFARASRVFNADQVDGWSPPAPAYPHGSAEVVASVGALVEASQARIEHDRAMACYRIAEDLIEMPALSAFRGSSTSSATQAYAATLLHELVHWTGAAHRLDRGFAERFDKEKLAAEELVAEIGAAYLCADLGVSNAPRPDHAAYVASWLRLLRNDRKAIFTASKLANRAATFLNDLAAAA